MKRKPAARGLAGKVHLSATATGLTSQAGLIPVVKFLERIGFEAVINRAVPHQRGGNADYQLTDMVFMTLVPALLGIGGYGGWRRINSKAPYCLGR